MDNFQIFGIENGNCSNYSVGGFNAAFSQNAKTLLAMNFNMQSFDAKIDEFSLFLHDINVTPKILCLTETWFTISNKKTIDGYKDYHSTRDVDHERGGVSLLILDSIPAKCVEISSNSSPELEHIHIRMNFSARNMKKIDVIGIYRPPNASINNFFSSMETLLNNVGSNNDIIIMGDFNICGLIPSPELNVYLDLMCSFALMPHIDKVTRPNPRGEDSLLDHTWTNFGFDFQSGVFHENLISDHYISFTFLPLDLDSEKKKIAFRDHSEANINKMIAALINFRYFF